MSKAIQLVQIEPEELVGLISLSVKDLFSDLVKESGKNKSDELLTPKEVCALFKIDNTTLWRWGKAGKVMCYGIGGSRFYKKNELLESLVPLNKAQFKRLNVA